MRRRALASGSAKVVCNTVTEKGVKVRGKSEVEVRFNLTLASYFLLCFISARLLAKALAQRAEG